MGLVNAGQALEVTNSGSDSDLTVTGLAATATTLNVYDTDFGSTFQYISTAGTQTVDLTVDNVGVTTAATVTLAGIETVNLQSGDGTTQTNSVFLTAANATTVSISGESDLNFSFGVDPNATTLLDASTFTGDLTANISNQVSNTSATTVLGGSGDDTFTVIEEQVGTGTVASSLDGGDGSNILSVSWASNQANVVDAGSITITNIQGMALTAQDPGAGGPVNLGLNAALVGGLATLSLAAQDNAAANTFTISGLTAAQTVSVGEAEIGAQLELSGGTGVTAVNVGLNIGADSTAAFDINQVGTALTTLNLTTDGNSYSNVDAEAGAGTFTTINVLGGASGEALTIGGSNAIVATTFNAATFASDITATFGAANQSIVGGTGDDTFNFAATLNTADTINGGAGDNTVAFTLGAGLIGPTLSNIQNLDVSLTGVSNTMSLQNSSGVEAITIVESAAAGNDATFSNLDASLANVTVEDDVDNLSVTTAAGQLANTTLTIGTSGIGLTDIADVTMNVGGNLTVAAVNDTVAAGLKSISGTLATNATSVTFQTATDDVLDVAGVVTADSATAVTVSGTTGNVSVDGANSFDLLSTLAVTAAAGSDAVFVGTVAPTGAATVASATLNATGTGSLVNSTLNINAGAVNTNATLTALNITNGAGADVIAAVTVDALIAGGGTGVASIGTVTITNNGAVVGDTVQASLGLVSDNATGTQGIGTLNVAAAGASLTTINLAVTGSDDLSPTITAGALSGSGTINLNTVDATSLNLSGLTTTAYTGALTVAGDADLDALTGTSYGETLDVSLNITGATVTGGEGSDAIALDDTADAASDYSVYTSQADSTGTVYDYISGFVAGGSFDDFLDFADLLLGGASYGGVTADATITYTSDTDVTYTITTADAAGFFGASQALAADNGAGNDATVVFVDANLSGSWEAGSDMAIVLLGVDASTLVNANNFVWA